MVRPLVIGHRGAPGYRPEHTRSSYEFALTAGVDAVEPDVVVSRDGVLVVRHENEISGTTDVADRPEFADRRTTKVVDGEQQSGWFTEDFTWDELATLRCRERIPQIRPLSASFDDTEPMLRLVDLLELVAESSRAQRRPIGVVAEIKHATYFAGIGLDQVPLMADASQQGRWGRARLPLIIESFEQTVLTRLKEHGVDATYIYLLEDQGAPFDAVSALGSDAPTYASQLTDEGLDVLAGQVDGISLDKSMILDPDVHGVAQGPSPVVRAAQSRGLKVFTWTCRPENVFLIPGFRDGKDARFGDYSGEWRLIREAGVDGVFVDHPDLGVAFFR